jgi:hypothetical protein
VNRKIELYTDLLALEEDESDICSYNTIYTEYGVVRPRLFKHTNK